MAISASRPIVVCGHLCLDIILGFPPAGEPREYFRPGRLSIVDAPVISTGGAVSNVGLALHRLGLPVRLAAKIGDDHLGRIVLARIEDAGAGLGRGIAPVEGEVTSYTVVLNPPGIDRTFLHCPGANDTFTAADVPDAILGEGAVFHFGYPPLMARIWSDGGTGLAALFARAGERGMLTSLDMSLPDPASPSGHVDWDAFLARVLPRVDLFVPSIEELLFMTDRPGFDAIAARGGGEAVVREVTFAQVGRLALAAISRGVSAVLVKLGDRGAYLRTGPRGLRGLEGWETRELYTPVFKVPRVAGTTGAGDSTIAGFLASIVKGLSPADALTMAVAVGGCCVEALDAITGIRSWEETRERIDAGWRRAPAAVREEGWIDSGGGVWIGPGDGAR